jgi:hypothetical protein
METWQVLSMAGVGVLAAAGLAWRPVRALFREREFQRARRDFHRQRERLEARFLTLAAASGKPRGLRWSDCDFDDAVAYARDRRSGELSAYVAATIAFEAVAGGGMEDVEAVGNLRAGTAVFLYRRGHWCTEGRAVFNLNPAEAIEYYRERLELVGQEVAGPM